MAIKWFTERREVTVNKRVAMAILAAAAMAFVTACGHAAGSITTSSASPRSSEVSVPASQVPASPATSVSPATGNVLIDCFPGGNGNIVTIDTASGKVSNVVPPWPAFSYQGESFPTEYGSVSWKPTNDTYSFGQGDPCQGWQWNPQYTRMMGIASIPNGNTVPAYVSMANNDLTFAAPVKQSTGFASAPKNTILDAVFGPDGSAWWVAEVSGSTTEVVLYHGTQKYDVSFPSDAQVQRGVTITFGEGGVWALKAENGYGTPVWATSKGISQKNPVHPPPSYAISSSKLLKLLPQTQYSISPGVYSQDRSEIAFFASSPQGGNPQLFTVPASGGNPTQVTHASNIPSDAVGDSELIYFGPSLG